MQHRSLAANAAYHTNHVASPLHRVQVINDFRSVQRVCSLRNRACLSEMQQCMSAVEAAYVAGVNGGISPKVAASSIHDLTQRYVSRAKTAWHGVMVLCKL